MECSLLPFTHVTHLSLESYEAIQIRPSCLASQNTADTEGGAVYGSCLVPSLALCTMHRARAIAAR